MKLLDLQSVYTNNFVSLLVTKLCACVTTDFVLITKLCVYEGLFFYVLLVSNITNENVMLKILT